MMDVTMNKIQQLKKELNELKELKSKNFIIL